MAENIMENNDLKTMFRENKVSFAYLLGLKQAAVLAKKAMLILP